MQETSFVPSARNNEALKSLYVLRQVYIVYAITVVVALLLMYFIHAVFALVLIVLACEQLIAGVVGKSALVAVVEQMPWNKK
jgi:hypothetical protein